MNRRVVSPRLALLLTQLVLLFSSTLAQGTGDPQDPAAARERANKLYDQGKYAEGIIEGRKALDFAEQAYGANDLRTAGFLHDLARLNWAAGDYPKAETLYQRSLEIKEAALGKEHTSVAQTLSNLAIVYRATGQFSRAESLYQRSLRILEANLGKDHTAVAHILNNLALVYTNMGKYAQAEPLFQRSLQILETNLGKDHVQVSDCFNNLAMLYAAMGQYAKAESFYRRSLAMKEATLAMDHPSIALSIDNLALLYLNMGRYAKAEPLFQRSLELREKKLGPDHPDVAQTLNNLGVLYWKLRQFTVAEPLYKRSLQIREAKLGPDHPDVAQCLNNLAVLYWNMGDYARARPLLERGLKIKRAKLGDQHPDIAQGLNNLAELNAALGLWGEALALTDRHRKLIRRHVQLTLPVLSDGEQLNFLHNMDELPLHVGLTLGLERRTDTEFAAASAAWLLNSKAIAQEALAERSRLALASDDPKTAEIAGQLIGVRQQLAALTLSLSAPGQEAQRRDQIASLTEKEQQLTRKLGQLVGQESRADLWVTVEEIRKTLPDDGIFINLARFRMANFTPRGEDKRWKGYRYAAWLIPPAGKGEVRLIDLGEAEKIDAAVSAVRGGLLAAQGNAEKQSVILEKGEPDAEAELRPAFSALAKLVLEPLAGQIGTAKQWLISPDAALWLVPWSALPLDDKTYAIEKHAIRYLVSGRELVNPAGKPQIKPDPCLQVADPDFDLDPKEALVLGAKLLGQPEPQGDALALVSSDRADGRRSGSLLGTVSRLEGTRREAAAVKPKLMTYAAQEPWLYRGKNALEAVVKAFHSPRVVVLSTHGYFLENQQLQDEDRAADGAQQSALTRDGKLAENPLLRCGLLLAGCNQAGRVAPGQDDGVLTGLEIAGLDLRGTDLVVLSACETGLGQVRNGEGVAGLRLAFQLAGARSVVATLWQVPDNDTALLMSDFFDRLAAGATKAEALRQAQLARIKAHRNRFGAAHPFYWAAFTLTGK